MCWVGLGGWGLEGSRGFGWKMIFLWKCWFEFLVVVVEVMVRNDNNRFVVI